MMYCPYCGKQISDQAQYCPGCGRAQEDPYAPVQQPPQRSSVAVIAIAVAVCAVAVIGAAVFAISAMGNNDNDSLKQEQAVLAEQEVQQEKSVETEDVEEISEPEHHEETPATDYTQEAENNSVNAAASAAYLDYQAQIDALRAESNEEVNLSNYEMKMWAKSLYERSDELLNEIYQDIKTDLSDSEFIVLRDAERAWIAERDATAEANAADWEGGTGYELIYTQTLFGCTLERCQELIDQYLA